MIQDHPFSPGCAHQSQRRYRPPLWLILLLAGLLSPAAHAESRAYRLSLDLAPGQVHGRIRLLGSLKLDLKEPGRELSGLAWDGRAQRLYAVSDGGHLVHLLPSFHNGMLTGIRVAGIYPLRAANGIPLRGREADAEGLQILPAGHDVGKDPPGQAELAISFEQHMRIDVFRADGHFLRHVPLPARLADARNYQGPNQGLEGICLHPRLGFLLAPQRPLRGSPPGMLSLYDLAGHEWRYPALAPGYSSSVALEALPDGDVLMLERIYRSVFEPYRIAIRRLHPRLPSGTAPLSIRVDEIADLDTGEGWRLDNFEGLAHHREQRYFMVSDDNRSPLQKTLLVYFEILEGEPP